MYWYQWYLVANHGCSDIRLQWGKLFHGVMFVYRKDKFIHAEGNYLAFV